MYTIDSVASKDLGILCDFIQYIDYNVDNSHLGKANKKLQEMLSLLLLLKLEQ